MAVTITVGRPKQAHGPSGICPNSTLPVTKVAGREENAWKELEIQSNVIQRTRLRGFCCTIVISACTAKRTGIYRDSTRSIGWTQTYHGTNHPGHVYGIPPGRAVLVSISHELGVGIQDGQTDIQDTWIKLQTEKRRDERGGNQQLSPVSVKTALILCSFLNFYAPVQSSSMSLWFVYMFLCRPAHVVLECTPASSSYSSCKQHHLWVRGEGAPTHQDGHNCNPHNISNLTTLNI